MAAKNLNGKDLRQLGFPEGKLLGAVLDTLDRHYKGKSKKHKTELIQNLLLEPAFYKNHPHFNEISLGLLQKEKDTRKPTLKKHHQPYRIYGVEGIAKGALDQMEIAMRLPVTHSGALMPDAHQGYGLPIGGVLATNRAVIPYGVGVDIGCRMCLSVLPSPVSILKNQLTHLKKILLENTQFGRSEFKLPLDHPVLERVEFNDIRVLNQLKDKAHRQIGTSGGGNHFVEFGLVELLNDSFGIAAGTYLALLSHSGSRGLGASVAAHYTKIAMEQCQLPKEARHLAWLDLDTEAGQEYWQAMTLAGDYASANHHQIHHRIEKALGEKSILRIENHHNFAWKEKDADGNEIIVHRKGATPAGVGAIGIIPGSMTSPGFIVRGKGNLTAINSASHGAGRVLSRRKAQKLLKKAEVAKHLQEAGVELIGSGLDEAPMVYKDIHQVMAFQQDLVEVLGRFIPKIIRMEG